MTEKYIKDFINKNKAYIANKKYQELFDECAPSYREELAKTLMKANIQFIDKMQVIPERMFESSELTGRFIIPPNINKIAAIAFSGSNFNEIIIKDSYELHFDLETDCFSYMPQLKNIKLPNELKIIPPGSFTSCTKLKYIEIPEGVKYIDTGAFEDSGLTQIYIPSTIKGIGPGAFDNGNQIEVLYNGTLDRWGKVEIYNGNDNLNVKFLK